MVLLLCPLGSLLRNRALIFRSNVNSNLGFQKRKKSLQDVVLKELGVSRLVGRKLGDLGTSGVEEILKVLFALLQELQTGLVRERRVCAMYQRSLASVPGVMTSEAQATYIFCATSAFLRFFSN